ncbi:DUF4097 family beta strand repeat-containing protein [Bacillus suaedaesalsae]|uniref:DUF4097 family beta strand repeat protein n=1 Tax=Bacillus suaedaesalsae TaxID=2810349 RepID=A0ABS2DK15_9BACI|nr:DUF4097 family beta strand repeat-containing protein [Bacillus suaedaesalsae]MBM6618847.1 DUF4097 family beta strand repeat protein [Bacillus suaedaesalsae]
MRQWKIGTITAGVLLISLGVLWLGNNIWEFPIHTIIANAWPVLLIVLGIEVLIHQFFKKEESLKFDGFSIFLVIMLGLISMVIYGVQSTGVLPAISNVINGEKYSNDIQLTEDASNVEELVVEIPNGDITLSGSDTKEVLVDGILNVRAENEEKAKDLLEKSVTLKKVGKKLILKVEMPTNQSFIDWMNYDGTFNISLPKELFVKMNVANGDVEANDLLSGTQIELINGDLQIEDVTGLIRVTNQNGSITIKEIDGELIASLTNGDIDVVTSKITGAIDIETVNGEVTTTIPTDADVKMNGETQNGEVGGTVSWERSGSEDDHFYDKNGKLTMGKGTYDVDISSVNGDVTVKTN